MFVTHDEIRQQKDQGADFIKVVLVSPDVFFAAIVEGKRVGLPVLGHLQEGVDAAQASRAGFRSIEHLGPGDSIWIECSTQEAVLLADAAQHPTMKTPPIAVPAFLQKMLMKHLQKRLINPAAFDDAAYTARLQRALEWRVQQDIKRDVFVDYQTLANIQATIADTTRNIVAPLKLQSRRNTLHLFRLDIAPE